MGKCLRLGLGLQAVLTTVLGLLDALKMMQDCLADSIGNESHGALSACLLPGYTAQAQAAVMTPAGAMIVSLM